MEESLNLLLKDAENVQNVMELEVLIHQQSKSAHLVKEKVKEWLCNN